MPDLMAHFAATDWNEFHAKIPEEIHRGLYAPESHSVLAVPNSDEDVAHGLIAAHQEEHFPYRRDQHQLFGTHWTSDEGVARGFAQEHERNHFEDDQCPDHDEHSEAAPVVFHAQRPQRHEIENDPRRLGWQNVDDYTDSEHEVPIRHGAPVRITGVSWLKHTGLGPLWHRHDLREPVELRAEDRDSPSNPDEWNASLHTAAWHEGLLAHFHEGLLAHFAAWYHGTTAELEPGQMVDPDRPSHYQPEPEGYAFFTPNQGRAHHYAETALAREPYEAGKDSHVYQVEPVGPHFSVDPGGPQGNDRKSVYPLRVVRKVSVAGDPAMPEPLANPYHGTSEFGGRPEWHSTWFHGTTGRDHPDMSQGRPEEMHRAAGSSWPQPNKLLGSHLTPLRSVAQKFAHGVYASNIGAGSPGVPSAIVHTRLHMSNPAHFPTEKHLNLDIARYANDHYPGWHDQKLNDSLAWNYSDHEGTHRDWHAEHPYRHDAPYAEKQDFTRLAGKAQDVLQWHPELPKILEGYRQHLESQGHHGITYGNEVEGPGDFGQDVRHISAIATRPSQIETTHVEHIAPPNFGRPDDPPPEPHQISHKASEARNEPEDMLDRIGHFHAGHGGAYPGRIRAEAYVPRRHLSLNDSARLVEQTRKNGGLSRNLGNGRAPHSGYMVARSEGSHILDAGDFYGAKGPRILRDYVQAHHEALHHPRAHLGTWHDQESGKVFLDIARNIADKDDAVDDARANDQIAIWDVANGDEVATGGTGGLAKAAASGCPLCGLEQTGTSATMEYFRSRARPRLAPVASIAMPHEYGADDTAPPEGEIHRGVTLYGLADYHPQVHQVIHDESIPVADRAAHLMEHMGPRLEKDKWGGGGVGKHWSTSEKTARGFATSYENSAEHPWHEFYQNPGYTRVVFHAAPPKASHMITSPRTKAERDILPTTHGEKEVPLRNRAPVTLTGVSWSRNEKDAPWTRHDFPSPIKVKAAKAPSVIGNPSVFYHGSAHRFKAGDTIEPGYHKAHEMSSPEHVYLSASDGVARTFGGLAAVRNKAKTYSIYHVEPTGPVEPDPDGPGFRTKHPLRVKKLYERGSTPGDPNPWWNQPETGRGYPKQARIIDMGSSNGDRHVTCAKGHLHWGAYGAAGLLIRHKGEDGQQRYLLQKRSPYVNEPNTWSVPGGAIGKHESPEDGAWREAREEMGSIPRHVKTHHTVTSTDCGDWQYHTVVADAAEHFMPGGRGETQHETAGVGWHSASEIDDLRDSGDLHPGFAKSWEQVRRSRGPKTAVWDTSGSDQTGLYVRFGHWPKDERSFSPAGGYKEEGVSVYDLDKHGSPAIDHGLDRGHEHYEGCEPDCDLDQYDNPDNDPKEEMQGRIDRASRNRRYGEDKPHETAHLVRGEMSGVGYDGEPLLKNVRRVGDWIDHRHLFIPGAEKHRLARDEHDEDYEPPEEMPPRPKTAAARTYRLWRGEGSHGDAPVSEAMKGRSFTPDRVMAEDYAYQHNGHLYHLDISAQDKQHIAKPQVVWDGIKRGGAVTVFADDELAARKEHHTEGCPSCDPEHDETHRHQRAWLESQGSRTAAAEPAMVP